MRKPKYVKKSELKSIQKFYDKASQQLYGVNYNPLELEIWEKEKIRKLAKQMYLKQK